MSPRQSAARVVHEEPEDLPDPEAGDAGRRMRGAFGDSVNRLLDHHASEDTRQVAVQGEISSMKSWLLTFAAKTLQDRGESVLILVPQRGNREEIARRLGEHGVPYIEKPARQDLCAWDEWQKEVSYVDEGVCSNNGCKWYPDEEDLGRIAKDAISRYRLWYGDRPLQVDLGTAQELSEALERHICPFYLLRGLDEYKDAGDAVRVATVEKAFSNAGGDRFDDADVVLLDEAHTVSADTERVKSPVDIEELLDAMEHTAGTIRTSNKDHKRAKRDLLGLRDVFSEWADSEDYNPSDLFDARTELVDVGFKTLDDVGDALQSRTDSGSWDTAREATEAYRSLGVVREFFSELKQWRAGNRDFVRVRHDAKSGSVDKAYFRLVGGDRLCATLDRLYEVWEKRGTEPAIKQRWGGLLDTHLSGAYEGRRVFAGGDREQSRPAPRPLDLLRELTEAETLIGFSATHNEASDPARDPSELRSTRHTLVAMPLRLRTKGDEESGYHGKDAVDPSTPWFRELIEETQKATGAKLAAVPVNTKNEAKWDGIPVRTLSIPDGSGGTRGVNGLVPHSRAAVGSKDFEQEEIDAVLCGIQVQSPGETACRLLDFWDMVRADHGNPEDALEESWRLLAQSAVAGTIQAGGRFRQGATNLVFDRGELLELAGFGYERASAESPGFAGELVRRFEELKEPWETQVRANRARKTVEHLVGADSKSPTPNQYLSSFQRAYDEMSEEDAKEGLKTAIDEGRVEYSGDRLRLLESAGSG
ncbi:MAG: hypothetical protein ABEI27_13800 [Halobellus sp.]|uniref:hypothetical protein n=1 Tax=Halobellus sp. TaxID=1979212 RepID=UPI0035D446C3